MYGLSCNSNASCISPATAAAVRAGRSPQMRDSLGLRAKHLPIMSRGTSPAATPDLSSASPLLGGVALSKSMLYFGRETSQAPLDTALSETFTIRNRTKQHRHFAFSMPVENEKFSLVLSPCSGSLRPGQVVHVEATITVHCTTKMAVHVPLVLSPPALDQPALVLTLVLESVLSWRLDYDELLVSGMPVGEGSYGIVFRGEWRGQEVAIKLLKSQDPDDSLLEDFRHEAIIMEKLRSPYVVQFFGAVCVPGKMCLVTEFLPLGSVGGLIRARGRKSIPPGVPRDPAVWFALKVKFALDCARGMRFLHASGILHRDLKPDNLMVTSFELPVPIHCKLSDFGCTRDINEAGAKQFTRAVGTPIYMAPELLKIGAQGCYSESADVFSFGMCLYEVFGEREPYSDMPEIARMVDVVMFVSQGKRLPVPEDCPQAIKGLVRDCWLDNAQSRPTFLEVSRRLETIDRDAMAALSRPEADPVPQAPSLSGVQ
eukprot:m51a1_g2964 putative tyrosine protein (486) ;mRNA; r:688377-689938